MASEETKAQAARIIDGAARYLDREISKGRDGLTVANEARAMAAKVGASEGAQNAIVESAAKKAGRASAIIQTNPEA